MEYIRDYFSRAMDFSEKNKGIPTEDIVLSMLLDYWF